MANFNNNFTDKTQINQLNQGDNINNPQVHSGSGDNVGVNKINGNNIGGDYTHTQGDTVGNVNGNYVKDGVGGSVGGDYTKGDKNINSKNTNFKVAISITVTISIAIALYILFGTELGQSFLDQIFNF